MRFPRALALFALLALAHDVRAADKDGVTWISSTAQDPWERMPSPALVAPAQGSVPEILISPSKTYQTMDGFGGCFNEAGWVALAKASDADRKKVMEALFSDDGCAFNLGRLPIGASDFALDAYSLDDAPGDFALEKFSIARDKKQLIPFVKAAMAVRPSLQCWGSPWSPPAWMKDNNSYSKGSLKWDPEILKTYASYFARWVDAYRKEGINIFAVAPQNEPNIASPYPSCIWTGEQLREFIADYFGPALRDKKVELWLGTLNGDPPNGGHLFNYRTATVLEDPKANALISAITYQYDSRGITANAREMYPDKKLVQSETVCRNGNNSWPDAMDLYQQIKRYTDNGTGSYYAWNMVLDEGGMSTWNWKQNALITVDKGSGKVTYNGEYYALRHFSQFVKPGAKRVLSTGVWGDRIAFLNPDGSVVAVVANSSKEAHEATVQINEKSGNRAFKVKIPAGSINTFLVPAAR